MIVRFVLLIFIMLCTVCRPSDRIHCPENRPPKMKESRVRPYRAGKDTPESLSASMRSKRSYRREVTDKKADQKSPENIEEWDCPKPGGQKNTKIVKENIKRMKKNMRIAQKKRAQSDTEDSILPQTGAEK